jgi:hypothetical protein
VLGSGFELCVVLGLGVKVRAVFKVRAKARARARARARVRVRVRVRDRVGGCCLGKDVVNLSGFADLLKVRL